MAEPTEIELMEHTMQAPMEPGATTNAFGELSREKCLQALHNTMPHLLAFEAQWLTQPTRAISRNEKGDTKEFRITAGLDQGDPFSPVAFAATLPLGELQYAILQAQRVVGTGRPVTGCFSFLDDLTLAVAAVGLRLNMTKCTIYTPSQVAPPGMEDWWEQTKRHDGLIRAGRPHSIEEAWKQAFKAWERCFQLETTNSWKISEKLLVEPLQCCCTVGHITACYSRLDTDILLVHRRLGP